MVKNMKITRYNPDIKIGLTKTQVKKRIEENLNNFDNGPKTKSIKQIIASNFFTFFNLLNLVLGSAVFISGLIFGAPLEGLKNCLFMGVIFLNTLISITEEIISKKIIDKLSLLSEVKVTVKREGKIEEKNIDEIVLDDIVIFSSGHQVVCDSILLNGELEVNESFITGESEPITKTKGDLILSGSFIISGKGTAKVEHIGSENYISKISSGAKYEKKSNSVIMNSFEHLLKIISVFIVPIGIIMFAKELNVTNFNIIDSVFGTVASLIGMIPEGLILLTSSVMAVSIIRLSKHKVLVQKLDGVEALARVDIICLDKTGTLTEGKMKLSKIIPYKTTEKPKIEEILNEVANNMEDENATIKAIKKEYNKPSKWTKTDFIPFSSSRKFSSITFKDKGTYYLGAPEILLAKNKKLLKEIKEYQKDYRVLILASADKITKTPDKLKPLGVILIEDIIRKNASKTLSYFKKEGVAVKIISGDSLETVMQISEKCGLKNLKGVDVSTLSNEELINDSDKYDIYARVNPIEKKLIIESLQSKGHTVAMTGDGVNDVLALKASDCAISLKSGTDSARNVSELILLDSNFDALPKVVKEGRRTINNIERSSSLLLVKTIYTILLIIFSILLTTRYFFVPIQLTLITGFTIGIPSFILALEPNDDIVTGNFLKKILSKSLPIALTVFINIILVTIIKNQLNLNNELTSTLSVLLTSGIGFIYLYRICTPFNNYRKILFIFLIIGFTCCTSFAREFFNISKISLEMMLIFIGLFSLSIFISKALNKLSSHIFNREKI